MNIERESLSIDNKQMLLENYNKIFTSKVIEAVKSQKVEDLFVNYKGVMIGNRGLWLGANQDGTSYFIIGVNL